MSRSRRYEAVFTLSTEQTLGMLEEVLIDGDGGRALTLRRVRDRDADGIWSYSAQLRLPEGQMTTNVWDIIPPSLQRD